MMGDKDARRDGLRRGARQPQHAGADRAVRLSRRLRLRPARRRGAAHARVGDAASPRPRRRSSSTSSPRPTSARSYTSTQEQAWMLLAANALGEEGKDLKLDRQRRAGQRCRQPRAVGGRDPEDGRSPSPTTATTPVDAVVSVIGAALTPEPRRLQGLHHRAHLLHARRQAGGPEERHGGAAQVKQNDRLVVVVKVEVEGGGRPRAAGRPPAGRPRDREPAPRRQRRRQDARLAEDDGAAGAHASSATIASLPPSTSRAAATEQASRGGANRRRTARP